MLTTGRMFVKFCARQWTFSLGVGMVDDGDLKSLGCMPVRVQVPP